MPEQNVDNIAFLREAGEALAELKEAQEAAREQDLQTKRLEKSLASEKKAVADSIEMTIRKRKSEITDSYDSQIEQTQVQLRKVKAKREKAKNQGMKERMDEETADVREDNRRLSTELKTLFRQHDVPRFCNTRFFYALYYTRGLREALIFLITLVICFAAVPLGVYHLIGQERTLWLAGIYIVDILVFGGIYFAINNHVKLRYHETLRQGRKIRNQIRAGKKKIKAIKNSIRKDKNEDMYGLEDFDENIARLEAEKKEIADQKQDALTNFENSGKVLITKEITDNNQERISHLEEDAAASGKTLTEFLARVKVLSMRVAEEYEPRLGREFLQEDKLEQLIQVFENGMAANMTEAQELVRTGKLQPTLSAFPELPPEESVEEENPADQEKIRLKKPGKT